MTLRENKIIISCVSILLGILFIVNPGGTGKVIAVIAGIVVLIAGITDIVRRLTGDGTASSMDGAVGGIVKIIIGIFILTHVTTIIALLSYILGIVVLIGALRSLEHTLRLRREGQPEGIWHIILAVLVALLGIFMLFAPHGTVNAAIFVVGILLVVYGVATFYLAYRESH
ncbi:MAG: DUF308 domain-containing protein [Clostridiales bacterium]|nr:DUF308 domain-containing protein [Clostridiales bacterium]